MEGYDLWEEKRQSSGQIRPGIRSEDAPAFPAGVFNCYAETVAARFSGPGRPYAGLAKFTGGEARWTGEVRFVKKHLDDPLHWKEPEKIFVNSMSDLFHPGVQPEWLAEIFDVMARAKQHTYQILTKRPKRMLEALSAGSDPVVARAFTKTYGQPWPPKNWWFGVSIEDQKTANERLPLLAMCAADVRFVSYEPALGPVDLFDALRGDLSVASIDWLICGGESGSRARPMEIAWARSIRDTCSAVGIPFFMKQMGGRRTHNDIPIPEDLNVKEFPKC